MRLKDRGLSEYTKQSQQFEEFKIHTPVLYFTLLLSIPKSGLHTSIVHASVGGAYISLCSASISEGAM